MNTIVKIIIPTYNAGTSFTRLVETLKKQININPRDVNIIDSSSTDETVKLAKQAGFNVIIIDKDAFGHGKTRAQAVEDIKADILVFMTQDALPAYDDSIAKLCKVLLDNEEIVAAYGRQLPYSETDVFGTYAREYNYPKQSKINSFADRENYGIKTAFFSDSFAAYKRERLLEIGNFEAVDFGEDMLAAARLLQAGYKTAYVAEAEVYHSHSNTIMQEYERCKEIGRFHKNNPWLLKTYGKAEGEGLKFVIGEWKYLIRQDQWWRVPLSILRNLAKLFGYKVG